MTKKELIQQLVVALSAAGMISASAPAVAQTIEDHKAVMEGLDSDGVAEEDAKPTSDAASKAKAPAEAVKACKPWSCPQPLYGVVIFEALKSEDPNKITTVIAASDGALAWAKTEEGKEAIKNDPKTKKLIQEIRTSRGKLVAKRAQLTKARK